MLPSIILYFQAECIKVAPAHHSIIQKEVYKLLAKGVIEPTTGGAGFTPTSLLFLSVQVSYVPYSMLSDLIPMHIPTFKMPTIRQVWLLIQQGDFAFSIDLKDVYLYMPIVKHHHYILWFVWQHLPYQWKVLPFELATAHKSFHSVNP